LPPEYLNPGVYIEEINAGPQPIEGVETGTAALLGEAERGPTTPRLVTSFREYLNWFGGVFDATKFLPDAVRGFFENGGRRAVICRLVGANAMTAEATFGGFTVRAAGAGAWGNRVLARIVDSTKKHADGSSVGFRLQLAYWSGAAPARAEWNLFDEPGGSPQPDVIEDFDNLVTDETSPDFFGTRGPFAGFAQGDTSQPSRSSVLVTLVRRAAVAPATRPADGAGWLSGGTDDPAALDVADFSGLPAGGRTTVQGLAALEDGGWAGVSLVYAPAVSTDIARAIVSHCERVRFRFAVIDSARGMKPTAEFDPRVAIAPSAFAAFYYPWLEVAGSPDGECKLVPPGGHVLGIYVRKDIERGVYSAPANEVVRGALGLEYNVSDQLQDVLNPKGVNVIRAFPGRGIRVWGARTMMADGLWKYVPRRRFFIFLERSIHEGTQWVVFEPNGEQLWLRVTSAIQSFLIEQWKQGALVGSTPGEAFFVRCDRTTMTQDDIDNGRLICVIGIAPARPAEFVIFRIAQNTAEAATG
jgi:phage tail sheath protein FI